MFSQNSFIPIPPNSTRMVHIISNNIYYDILFGDISIQHHLSKDNSNHNEKNCFIKKNFKKISKKNWITIFLQKMSLFYFRLHIISNTSYKSWYNSHDYCQWCGVWWGGQVSNSCSFSILFRFRSTYRLYFIKGSYILYFLVFWVRLYEIFLYNIESTHFERSQRSKDQKEKKQNL